ncbi:MAG: F-type H+-transporting ATPase subunit b [Eubacteriaceae bacterium]|nr:F-type H+-transporting ATPase subunit b [Eubacteriaceae bacterium]MDK2962010.1 F-type H+-transporting ATPase subunit b [Eubacteriaceae bacterium]
MESVGLVNIDFRIMLATVVNFIIFFLIIKKFFYQTVKDMMAKRQEEISSEINAASKSNQSAKELKADYEEKIAEIHKKEREIIREANLEAQKQHQEIIATAKDEAKAIIDKAMLEINVEKERAMNEVKSNIVDLSLFATEKVIKQTIDKKQHAKLVESFIEGVGDAK